MGKTTPNNMDWRWILFCLLIAQARFSSQASTPTSRSYVAAVVEFAPKIIGNSSELTFANNVPQYERFIQEASTQSADIIVFPEDALTTYHFPAEAHMDAWTTLIPFAKTKYTPCSQNMDGVSQALKNISCAAQKNKIYVVINIAEKEACTSSDCPKKMNYFNTNVVFDRNGTIIARYRKVNLFREPQFNVTKEPEVVTFDTDFGVKFGTFICFDILFAVPSLNLTRMLGITDIVYPTAWFSETPFLTAVQTQAGWAYAEDVNLLAAGYNNPEMGNAGSGIYTGRTILRKVAMPLKQTSQLLIMEVPKKTKKPATAASQAMTHAHDHEHAHPVHDELRRKRATDAAGNLKLLRENISVFETEVVKGNITKTLCQNKQCCDFTIRVKQLDPKVTYRLVVFDGIRNYANVRNAAIRACAVIQCSSESVESCGSVLTTTTTFQEISVSGKFDDAVKSSLIMPNTLDTTLLSLPSGWTYDEHKHDDHKHVSMYSNETLTNLVTFGVYCRDFHKDDNNAASNTVLSFFSIVMTIVLARFL